jgi:hypothetical protein
MIVRNKYIVLSFTISMLIGCVNKEIQPINNSVVIENITYQNSTEWLFYAVSESPLVNLNKKTKEEIIDEFKNTKIEISDTSFTVENLCSFELYTRKTTPLGYWKSQHTVDLFREELSKKNIALNENIITYKSLYPEKACENPASDYFITDSTLVFSYYGYLVMFQSEHKRCLSNKELETSCFLKTKITELPITKEKIDGQIWNKLDCSISNLSSKDYIRLPSKNDILIFIIVNFEGDDAFYTLITMKDGKIITQENIGYAEDLEDTNSGRIVVEFEIDEECIFTLTTKKQEASIWKTENIKKSIINESGEFKTIE